MSDKIVTVSEVTEKCLLPETEKNETELTVENPSSCNDKIAKSKNANLKKDVSKEKGTLETLLSEGEASSGFETVSSVISNIDPDDFDLSSTADEDDFNVVVEIENELAFRSHKESNERTFFWKDTRNTTDGYDSSSMDFLNDNYTKKKHGFRIINRTQKHWYSSEKDKNYEYDDYRDIEERREKKFNEREGFTGRRPRGLHDRNWDRRHSRRYFSSRHDSKLKHSRSTDFDSRSRRSKSSDFDSRSRRSRSSDFDSRPRRSRSSDKDSRPRHSRSSDKDSRPRHSRSSDKDSRSRRSQSSDKDSRPRRSRSSGKDSRPRRSRSSDKDSRPRRSRSSGKDSRPRRSRSSDKDSRPRRSRCSDKDSRPRRSRSSDKDSKSRRSRSSDKDSRIRYSRSSDHDNKGRGSEGSSENDYKHKRSRSNSSDCRHKRSGSCGSDCRHKRNGSCDCDYTSSRRCERARRFQTFKGCERNIRRIGVGYENRRRGSRCSRSFDRNTPTGLERDSPPRKRRRSSYSKSPTSSVWKRLEGGTSSRINSEKKSRHPSRKKERTPFLVELERKLKEADRLKESKKENVQPETSQNDKTAADSVQCSTQNPLPSSNLVPEVQPSTVIRHLGPPKPRMPTLSPRTAQNMQNIVTPFRPTFAQPPPCIPRLGIPLNMTFPEMSVDNLPLVAGPSGLPVHITLTGEQIPYDMDGRRIPVGPNGYYLPLDPTGRLFPHIVSPGNQAVPIHMTEDGVLRLPNSEPVPYGPPHKLPVDIDGIIIPIGPDSRPLFPCLNLPKQPPLNILKMIGIQPVAPPNMPEVRPEVMSFGEIVIPEQQTGSTELPPPPEEVQNTARIEEIPLPAEALQVVGTEPLLPPYLDHVTPPLSETRNREKIVPPAEAVQAESTEPPLPPEVDPLIPPPPSEVDDVIPPPPEMGNAEEIVLAAEVRQNHTDSSSRDDTGPSKIDSALFDIMQNPSQKINKADLLENYKKKARERSLDILKCKEIEKNLGVSPSKGGVKRSTPMKFSKKKISKESPAKEDSNTTVTDMVLESDESDSTSDLKSAQKLKTGSVEEILLSSDEEQNILKAICDTETAKAAQSSAGVKPKDAIANKVQQAINSLRERNYKPPVVGRFIVSCIVEPIIRKSLNESPLLRNRIVLPFITPSTADSQLNDQSPSEEKTDITFKFLPQEAAEKGKKPPGVSKSGKTQGNSSNATRIPVFTFDFAMQCDFTSAVIKNLNSKIADLELEVVKLKNINANLIDSYKNVQAMNEKISGELRKAHFDISERKREIQALKTSLEKK